MLTSILYIKLPPLGMSSFRIFFNVEQSLQIQEGGGASHRADDIFEFDGFLYILVLTCERILSFF